MILFGKKHLHVSETDMSYRKRYHAQDFVALELVTCLWANIIGIHHKRYHARDLLPSLKKHGQRSVLSI